jgi:predicted MFS family arabinose efflux permease
VSMPGTRSADSQRFTQTASYRWVALGMGFLGAFGGVGLGRFGYSAILPAMQQGLQISSAAAGALASWNLGGYLIMAIVSGVLSHRFGPRRVVGVGSLVAALGMAVSGLAEGMAWASVGRLLTGLGSGAVFVPSVALMSSWFDARRRGMVSGIVASGPALAMVVAGPVVPVVIRAGGTEGWRFAWYLFAGLTFLVGVLTLLFQRDRPFTEPELSGPASDGWSSAGLLIILRSRYAWHMAFVYMSFGFAYMVYLTFFQRRLTGDLGLSSVEAGNLFLLLGAASVICGLVWGSISDHMGRGKALALNSLLQAAAAALFAWWPSTCGIILSTLLCGLTAIAVPGIIGAGCADSFGARLASTSLGFVTVFMGIGQVLGPYLAGRMADSYGTLKYSYLLSAGVFLVASVLAVALRDTKPQSHPV